MNHNFLKIFIWILWACLPDMLLRQKYGGAGSDEDVTPKD